MTIAVVTPWRDHMELADDYWEAMNAVQPDEVLIVDNASDPFLRFPQSTCHGQILYQKENLGFARASNLGMRKAHSEVVAFINNDISMTDPNWLAPILAAVEPGVLVGTLRYERHADVCGTSLPYLDGWCLTGMREDLLGLGGFDETLREPSYYSDNILCMEARAAGMTLREAPIGLHHKGNVTAGPGSDPEVRAATIENYRRYEQRAKELLVAA